jgi:MFS family permease
MEDLRDEPGVLSDEDIISQPKISSRMRLLILLISAFGTAARMIGRMFIEIYAVIIGSSATAIAFITSIRNLMSLAFQSSFGRISDFLGRKTLILLGLFGGGVTLALIPFIRNQWILVLGVFFFSLCFAVYSPAFTAMIGDLTDKKNRAGLFSLLTLVGSLGSLIGLLSLGELSNFVNIQFLEYSSNDLLKLGFYSISHYMLGYGFETEYTSKILHDQYSIILYSAACFFAVAGIIAAFLTNPPTEKLEEKSVLSFTPLRENKRFRRFVIVGSVMGFVMSLGWPIFPYVRGKFASARENTWIWATFSITMMVTLIITRPFIDKIKRKWTLFIGRVMMFFIPLNLALTAMFVQTWWHMAIGAAVSGCGNAFYMVAESSYALDCAPEKEKGTYTGLFYMFLGITTFLGSLLSGVLADVVENYLGELDTIILFLWIIAGARFIASLGFLFLKEPMSEKNG